MWLGLQLSIIGGVLWFYDGQFGSAPAVIGLTLAFLATFFLSAIFDALMRRSRPPSPDSSQERLDPRIGVMGKDHIAKPSLHRSGHNSPACYGRGGSGSHRSGQRPLYPGR
jgi:hypothetical protein